MSFNDVEVKVHKSRVAAKSRKLKATWTIGMEVADIMGFSNEILIVPYSERVSDEFPHGVNLRNVNTGRLGGIFSWLEETFSETSYNVGGQFDDKIWFKNDRDLTLFLMKWS